MSVGPNISRLLALATLSVSIVHAQQTLPIRTVETSAATDSGVFSFVTSVRHLSDGRVLAHDAVRRRILLFAPTLREFTVLADTAPGAPNKYGGRPVGLIPFLGDSTILVDTEAQAFIVIEPSGKFGRVMAAPKPSDLRFLASSFFGTPGFDSKGRLIYRATRPPAPGQLRQTEVPADGANKPVVSASRADSAPIVRSDFDTRAVDTIALMRLPISKFVTVSPRQGATMSFGAFNPLPLTDEWTLLPDGTVAIVRAQDYHIDWWSPEGKMTSTPKMPFEWKRITLEEKEALLDSVRKADEARRAALPPPPPTPPGQLSFPIMPLFTVDASDMGDYYPPVRTGQVKADPEGRVWVLPSTASNASAGLVFDVVDRAGTIVERVKLPEGRNLAGFGPDGVVYMIYAPNPKRILLERGRIVR